MEEIVAFMDEQYDSIKFIVQERFRFWSQMQVSQEKNSQS